MISQETNKSRDMVRKPRLKTQFVSSLYFLDMSSSIGIISAVPAELHLILEELQSVQSHDIAGRTFHHGFLFNKSVILVLSGIGKVSSAVTSTILIQHFKISSILFIGTAGALSSFLKVGDIVIADKLAHHDFNCDPIFHRGLIPSCNKIHLHSNPLLLKSAITSASAVVSNPSFIEALSSLDLSPFPSVKVGLVMSGDRFINDPVLTSDILSYEPFSTALCCEMEGAAVAQVCSEFDVPFVVVRIVSDGAGDGAHVDWTSFCDCVAGKFGVLFVEEYLKNI
ncbi:hypothetical protein GEMRC1_006322 [Eukaryota sp. GEM-RC1]